MLKKEQIMVSVAIPVYNQQRYITETLLSALNQKTDFDYEIVVGDDCSTDDTRSILADFKQKYPQKINIIYNEKNIGSLLNEKSVLDHCKGKYIALLDGDDLFFNEKKLQRQYDFLENNPQYGVVHSDARLLIEDELSESKVFDSRIFILLNTAMNFVNVSSLQNSLCSKKYPNFLLICIKRNSVSNHNSHLKNMKYSRSN